MIYASVIDESAILKTYCCGNLPCPLFAKEGEFLPFAKGEEEGFGLRCVPMQSWIL